MKIKGVENVINKLKKLNGSVDKSAEEGVAKTLRTIQADAKLNVPNKTEHTTGYLRNSITQEIIQTKDSIKGKVQVNAEYGAYVEFGTGPTGTGTYPYNPPGISLSYKGDKWKVNIPDVGVRWIAGQRAQPYLYPAFLIHKDKLSNNIIESLNRQIEALGG